MALTKVSGEVITRPLVLTGNASVSGIMTVGIGSTTTTINGSQDFPTIRPTLDLNFAATKTLDRRITFTRNSIGTYTDEFGIIQTVPNNVPRFDHDPVTGESLGLLIEESRTNRFVSSIPNAGNWSLTNVGTVNTNTITENYATAPDGTTTATRWQWDIGSTSSDRAILRQGTDSLGSSTLVTLSIYLKSNTGSNQLIALHADGGIYSGSVVTVTPEWQRFRYTYTSAVGINNGVEAKGGNGSGLHGTQLAEQGDILVWGAQLEAGSFATSYIPTRGSTVTRAADIAKITGTNFTGFYNQTEGTIFFRYKNLSLDTSTIRGVWGLENSSAPVSGVRSPQSAALRIRLLYNNNFSPAASNLFLISTDYQNGIVSYNQTENRLMMNGTSDFVSATHTNDNDIIAMSIGSRTTNGDSPLGGHISHLTYYNKRLTNAQLQSLTRQ